MSERSSNLLEKYRGRSSFKKEGLAEFIDSAEAVQFKKDIFSKMEKDPLFKQSTFTESLEEIRRKAYLRASRIKEYGFLSDPRHETSPYYFYTLLTALTQYDLSVMSNTVMPLHFFGGAVKALGSEQQQQFYTDVTLEKIVGCFALTEVGHGSDARNMRTTATYEPSSQQFILHTEDFEAAKCWIGNLGQISTHVIVFAQLITPDGQNQGLHGFITPIRDPDTLLPFPGVFIGDMGEKIGLNGIDNGFCMFDHYRVPRENMLNKYGDISADGQYNSAITDPRKRFAYSLGTLLGSRVGILNMSTAFLTNAITIAVRYSAVRRQFGPSDEQELSIIEYPLQQWRLFPYLAALFAMKTSVRKINTSLLQLVKTLYDPDKIINQDEMDLMAEMHALLSSLKAVYSWTAQAAIQQCREACGGHGYLKGSSFADLRDGNDSSCTYEGDNNVLQQQASNWVLRLWRGRGKLPQPPSPLASTLFLYQTRAANMTARSEAELCHPPVILETYRWLVCFLAERTSNVNSAMIQGGKDKFTAHNHSQVYAGRNLSIAYGEHFMLQTLWDVCCKADEHSKQAQTVLTKLCALFGLSSLEKHLVYLHQGKYIDGVQSQLILDSIMSLCGQLKNEAVSLVDVVAPPDFILNSFLGNADGNVYKHLEKLLMSSAEKMGVRPKWWPELSKKLRSHL